MSKVIRQYLEDSESFYHSTVDREIERNRKGDFTILLWNRNGEPLKGDYRVEVELERIDYNFGANIFMLGEYEEETRNRKYEEEFVKLFNAATVPLYWEGTEPTEGYLRYDADIPRDVYRRPPADAVVKFCKENHLEMKGHPLFWHEFVPKWLPENYDVLKKHIYRRFEEIAVRYAKDIPLFDVVNEPSRIYDCYMRDRYLSRKPIVPEDDYCVWLFRLAREMFPANKLILNDTVWASFTEFRGKYSGYYLNIKDLLNRGVEIDEIGMQCHLGNQGPENAYNSERLYQVLDTYAEFGKTINISEIGIPSKFEEAEDLDCQAEAAERLYKTVFSHPATTGLTWWNLPDDGILTTKRVAGDENLPSSGLLDPLYREKTAYQRLHKLIRKEWTTKAEVKASNGMFKFRGFYGKYKIHIKSENMDKVFEMDLGKRTSKIQKLYIQE